MTLAEFISLRLKQLSCRHVFGVVGTSCAGFVNAVVADDSLEFVPTVNELEAGYMADGYGRQGKLGAVCVSYGVGTLSMANAIASALTERVPIIVINGGPSQDDYALQKELGVLFSHSTGFGETDLNVYQQITVDAIRLETIEEACLAIDNLLRSALNKSGPVYLEVPEKLWSAEMTEFSESFLHLPQPQSESIDEVSLYIQAALAQSVNPVVVLGSELIRRDMVGLAKTFLEAQQLPFFTLLLSKSLITEDHPLFRGVYDSDLAPSSVTLELESADLIICLGCVLGIDHRYLVKKNIDRVIQVGYGTARIGRMIYEEVHTEHVLANLCSLDKLCSTLVPTSIPKTYESRRTAWAEKYNKGRSKPHPNKMLNHDAVFQTVDTFFSRHSSMEFFYGLDTCLASFPGADVPLKNEQSFLSNPIWLSIGQGTPATIGAYFATGKRPFIVTGDGGFQMVAQTFSTMVQQRVPAIIIIMDNGAYAIEQFLLDGDYFLDESKEALSYTKLNAWKYENLPQVFNGGYGARVDSVRQLEKALEDAVELRDSPAIIAATIPDRDLPAENMAFLLGIS